MSAVLRKIKLLTLALVVGLAGGTQAATPVAVWDGDFTTMTKGNYTLAENGNTKTDTYLQISGDQGILVTSSAALNVFTVIVRCSGLNLASANNQVLFTAAESSGSARGNLVGVNLPAKNAVCRGIWAGADWDNDYSVQNSVPANYTTLIYNHQQTNGTYAYALGPTSDVDDAIVRTTLYSVVGLRSSGSTYNGCAIGGLRGTTSTSLLPATGLKITSIAVFSGTLTEAEMKGYVFPSEIINVTRTIAANADVSWSDAAWTVGGTADEEFTTQGNKGYNVTITVDGDCTIAMPTTIGNFASVNVRFALGGGATSANVTLKYSGALPSDSATTAVWAPLGDTTVTTDTGVTLSPVYDGDTTGYLATTENANLYIAKRPDIGVYSVRIGWRGTKTDGQCGNGDEAGYIEPSYSAVGPYPMSGSFWNHTKVWRNNSTGGVFTDIQNLTDAANGTSTIRMGYYGRNSYFNNSANYDNDFIAPNGILTATYIDDSDSGTGNLTATDGNTEITLPTPGHQRGWQLHFDGIPFNAYDVYFVTASDVSPSQLKETPIYVSLDGGTTWKTYVGDSVNEKTVMGTGNWTGLPCAQNGVLTEGKNYIKMRITKSIYGDNIGSIDITHGARNTGSKVRSGLAAIQIVEVQNDGVYTLAESGEWSDTIWNVGNLTGQTWTDTVDGVASIAKIESSETVSAVTVDQAVSAGSVILTGSDPFTVAGSSTLTVGTGFDAAAFTGALNLQAPITGTIYIGANTDLQFGGDTDMTLPTYTLDGAGAWKKVGSGKLTVNNALTLPGTINAGTVEYTSSTSGNMSLFNGNVSFAGGASEVVYSGAVSLASGGAGKTVISAGTVQVTGSFATDIDVGNGAILKLGTVGGFGSSGDGATESGKTITVKTGGTIELNGTEGCNAYTLAGGTLQNTGTAIGTSQRQTTALTLTADSTVNAGSDFGLLGSQYANTTITLGGNKLVKIGTQKFLLCKTSTDSTAGGEIDVNAGTLWLTTYGSTINVPVVVADDASVQMDVASTIASVSGEGSVTGSAMLTTSALDLSDGLTVSAPVTLADGATVTLGTGSITGAITVPDNASVTVDATDAVVEGTTTVLSSMTIGEGATIDVTNLPAGYAAQITENSVVLVQMVTVTIPPVTGATLVSVTCGGNEVSIVNGTVTVPAGSTITLNWAAEEGYIIGTTPTTFDVGTEATTVSGTGLIETVQAVARANDTLCPSLTMAITVVPDGGTVTLLQPSNDNITLSNNKSIVFVENGNAFGGTLTGNGTIKVSTEPTATTWSSARFANGWTGTFVVGWDMSGKMMPDKYGITGSTVEVSTEVTSGYFNTDSSGPAAPSIAPALYFDKDVTISDGFGGSNNATTFAKVGMAANKTFATRGNATSGRDCYYTFTELNGFDGTLSVRANDHVTIGAVKTVGMPAANTVIVACTKTNGEILNGDGNDASVYPVDVIASVEFDNQVHEFPGKAVYATIGNASGLYYAVANIGDKYYATYAAAVADYTAGDTIVVSDATAGNVPTGWELTSEGTRLTKIQVPITWDVDGVQTVTYVDYGDTPSYTGETPTRTATAQYTYAFTGWTPAFDAVTEATTYTAQFSSTVNQYTLTVPEVEHATATVSVGGGATDVRTFDYGTVVTVTWIAADTYKITAGGTEVITLTENKTAATPTVELDVKTFTVVVPANTVVTVDGQPYTAGDEITRTIGTTVTITYVADGAYVASGTTSQTFTVAGDTAASISAPDDYTTTAAVAQINTTYYASLRNAFEAAAADATIKVIANNTMTGNAIAFAKNLTLDLNGFVATHMGDGHVFEPTEGATFTITDTSDGAAGKVVSGSKIVLSGSPCTFTLEAGTLQSDSVPVYIWGNGPASERVVNINGGKLVCGSNSNADSCIMVSSGTIRMSAGVIESVCCGFEGTTVNVSGGNVTVGVDKVFRRSTDRATGGTFNKDVSAYCTSGYICVDNGNGTYSVVSGGVIKFVNDDGTTVLQTLKVRTGDTPAYTGETPTKTATAQYTYTFSGWDDGTTQYGPTDALPAVTGDVTYTATYSSTVNQYTLTLPAYDSTTVQPVVTVGGEVVTGDNGVYTVQAGSTVTITWEAVGANIVTSEPQVIENVTANVTAEGVTAPTVVPAVAVVGGVYKATLAAAIAAVPGDGTATTVKLLDDITGGTVAVNGGRNVVLDLDGNTLTPSFLYVLNGALEIANGTLAGTVYVYGLDEDGTGMSSTFTLAAGATVDSEHYGVIVYEYPGTHAAYDAAVTIAGTVNGNVWVMGNIEEGDSTLTVSGTVDATGKSDVGIALNGAVALSVVDGASVESDGTGIEVRAGALSVTGGTIVGNGVPASSQGNNNGTTSTGAGIAVSTYDLSDVSVSVTGGEVKGYAPLYVVNTTGTSENDLELSVTGGTFTTINDGPAAIVVDASETRAVGFVSGGTFSSAVDPEYCVAGYIPVDKGDGTYGVKEGSYVAEVNGQGYETLAAAIAAVPGDGNATTVKLLDDITGGTVAINGGRNVVLDLDGNTLTPSFLYVLNGALEIANGTLAGTVYVYGLDEDGTGMSSTFTLAAGATVDSEHYGVIVYEYPGTHAAYDAAVTIAGTVNGNVWVMGNIEEGDSTLTVSGTVDATGKSDVGIALNGAVALSVVDGASVESDGTGIEVRAGALSVTGGTIVGNGVPASSQGNNNGTTSTGAGIAVSTYDLSDVSVSVTGGEVKGYAPLYVVNTTGTSENDLELSVTGGTFTTINDGPAAIVVDASETRAVGFVFGGTFTEAFDENYLATGMILHHDEEAGKYIVIPGEYSVYIDDKGYETLAEAVEVAADGDVLRFVNSVELTATVVIDKSITLDLNGNNIAATGVRALWVKAGEVELTGTGTVSANGDALGATSSVIRVGDGDANTALAKLTVGANVTVASAKCYGITTFGKNTRGIELVVSGTVAVTSTGKADAAIAGNGNKGLASTIITIKDGAVVSATNGAGIFFPGAGTLAVEGGTITGPTAVYVKSGNTKILGGTLHATGEAAAYTYKGDGVKATGDALVIDNCGYPNGAPTASVTGGTLTSDNAKAIGCYAKDSTFTVVKNVVPAKVGVALNPARFGDAEAMGIAAGYELVADGTTGLYKLARTANTVAGTVDVVSAADTTIVAVPEDCNADELINLSNRVAGDVLKAYVKAENRYYTWELVQDGDNLVWKKVQTWVVGGATATNTKEASAVQLKKGEAVWVTRINSSEPVYVNGSYAEEKGSSQVTVEAGYNLVAPVPTEVEAGAAEVVINEVVEKSENTSTDVIFVPPTETAAPVALDCKPNETTGELEWGYDYIEVYTDANGKKRTRTVRKTDVKIPSGTGFWYINNSNTDKQINL